MNSQSTSKSDLESGELIQAIESGLPGARNFTVGRIPVQYYWRRKRREVLRLVKKHRVALSGVRADPMDKQVFVELGCGKGTEFFLLRDTLAEAV